MPLPEYGVYTYLPYIRIYICICICQPCGGGRGSATGTNQLAHALETRDDEVASASLLVQAMWKADDHQPIYELKRHGSDQCVRYM